MTHTSTTDPTGTAPDALAASRYVRLTTYTRDGTPKHAPVWPVAWGSGQVAFITAARTWKVRRIASTTRVQVQPSDARGRVSDSTVPVAGTAEIVTGEAYEAVRRSVNAKYGYQLRLVDLMHKLPGERTGHPTDCAVVITLAE